MNLANPEQLQDIKEKLDAWMGMPSEQVQWHGDPEHHIAFEYKSPTGVLVAMLEMHWYRGIWRFAGRSGLPRDIDTIRKLIEPMQPTEEQLMDAVFQKD